MLDGTSTDVATDACALALVGGKLVDFKFLNDDVLFVLWQPEGTFLHSTPFHLATRA